MNPNVVGRAGEQVAQPDLVRHQERANSEINGLIAGTRLWTLDGEMPVQYLSPGDRIITRDTGMAVPWDTLICGHWHQLMQLPDLIVNGSLKGYDEYAFQNNFEWEAPAQALWITHPEHGITFQMPVYLGEGKRETSGEWVSWPG